MAKRYWLAKWSMGYVGTDSEEEIDLVDFFGLDEKEVEEMSDDEAREEIEKYAWESACEMVSSWAEPVDD
jgi:hypothetical protein